MLYRIATPTRISLFIRVRYLQTATPARNKKLWDSVDDAVKDVKSGDVLLCGGQYPRNLIVQSLSNTLFFCVGFGLSGIPGSITRKRTVDIPNTHLLQQTLS